MTKSSAMFEYQVTVRGYEIDSYDHLNNAVYLNYVEQARWEILRESNLVEKYKASGLLLVVIEANIRFIREVVVFDELNIKTDITTVGPYVVFQHSIYNSKTEIKVSEAKVKCLFIGSDRIPVDIPEEFIEFINNHV